jgi:predicted DNA-binding transcriptional regulator YafY
MIIAEITGILLLLLALVGIQVWKRWQKRRRYSHSERARLIAEAVQTGKDLRVVYWSRTEKKMIKCVLTPHRLHNVFLEGYDQTHTKMRRFKTTRIKELQIIGDLRTVEQPVADPSLWVTRVLMLILGLAIACLFAWLLLHGGR